MTDVKPPVEPTPPNPPTAPATPKKSNAGKYIAIGCLSIIVLAAVGGYLAYRGVKGVIAKVADQYTSTEPLELPEVSVTDEQASTLLDRVGTFTQELTAEDGTPPTLVLTSQDINTLIERHPDWSEMSDKLRVSIEGNQIHGQTSIPLGAISGMFEGRYLNALAVFRLELTAGRLAVYLDSAEVGGQALPEEVMNALRSKNLAEKMNEDPKAAAILDKLQSVTVQNGTLHIVPKTGP